MRHITGDPDRPPTRVSVSLTDYITGLFAAYGTVTALLNREKTGKGQIIDAALYECAFNFMEPYIPAYEKLGLVANRTGSRLPNNTPNNTYRAKGGEYIHIAAVRDRKSVGEGKGVAVRVDIGGRRNINKKRSISHNK